MLASGVFLKSLTLQGFKSFADRTTLEFNPGVSVIVGPNGSGKSNLSDAIAWVLGEQGPKTLRGGKMEDVIFAGTSKRQGAGRAEVSLTIDNSSGALPIDFSEVTITRTIFRGGESEYAINSVPCRLLDLQELLSDSGIGRELHTIVGQGQLDQVLQARPEERRAYIEEAAGILKFRRRKERAVRKLERTDADLERLGDVIAELRRQIRPLEQQAETAKRSVDVQTELAEVSLWCWVHDWLAVSNEGDGEAEQRLEAEAASLAARVTELDAEVEALETESVAVAAGAEAALSSEYRLSSVRERVSGLARLAEERARHLEELATRAPEGESPPPEVIAAAEAERSEVAAERAVAEAEARAAEEEWMTHAAAQEAAVRAREEIVHLQGERAALRAAVHSAEEERRRLSERRAFLARRREARREEIERTAAEIRALDDREEELDGALERARDALRRAQDDGNKSTGNVRDLERSLDSLRATQRVLVAEASRGAPVDLIGDVPGLIAVLRKSVRPSAGFERALRAALEPVADAIVAARGEDAIAAVHRLRGSGRRAQFVVPFDGPAPPAGVPTAAGACADAPEAVKA
ncbi:MAG: chromosome segregation SMC family protein, partial [Actinomycetota bacterium]